MSDFLGGEIFAASMNISLHPQTVRPTEGSPLKLKIRILRAEVFETMLYAAAASRGARGRATTTRCAEPTTAS